jgi:hypothetical protein
MEPNSRQKFIHDAFHCLESSQNRLTAWEMNFFVDIRILVKRGRELSQRQYNTLQDIYQKYRN